MFEKAPKTEKSAVTEASMEGNIKMPQNGFYITLNTLAKGLTEAGATEFIHSLIAPIPDDEALQKRTDKANAQHAHHNIERELSTNEVRDILVWGNIQTLNLLARLLDLEIIGRDPEMTFFDDDGSWDNGRAADLAEEILEKLTPEKIAIIKDLTSVTTGVLTSDEIKILLRERKQLYQDWSAYSDKEKLAKSKQANAVTNEIIETVDEALMHKFMKSDDVDTKLMTMKMQDYLVRFLRTK